FLGEDAPAPTPPAGPPKPSIRPAKDKPAKPQVTLTPVVRPVVPPPPKPTPKPSPTSEIAPAFGAGRSDDDDPDPGWESLTQPDETPSGDVFSAGALLGLSAAPST